MLSIQMNTRLDASIKSAGDAVLARYGMTPSEAVRGLWDFLATHAALPEFLREDSASADRQRLHAVEEGEGMVHRYAVECGIIGKNESLFGGKALEELVEEIREERVDEFVREAGEDARPAT